MTKVEGKLGSNDQIRTGLGRPAIKRLTGGSDGGRSLPTELRPVNSRDGFYCSCKPVPDFAIRINKDFA